MGETNSKIIIVGDFNTPLLTMGRLSSQEIKKKKEALDLNYILNWKDLTLYRHLQYILSYHSRIHILLNHT